MKKAICLIIFLSFIFSCASVQEYRRQYYREFNAKHPKPTIQRLSTEQLLVIYILLNEYVNGKRYLPDWKVQFYVNQLTFQLKEIEDELMRLRIQMLLDQIK